MARRLSSHKYPNTKEAHAWVLYQCGLSNSDIANELECALKYVAVAISRCRLKMTKLGIRVEKIKPISVKPDIKLKKINSIESKFDALKRLASEAGLIT